MPHTHSHIDGLCYPSVTEILHAAPKPWLDKWLLKNPVWGPKKTAAANKIGTEFHRCVELKMLGKEAKPQICIPRITKMLARFDEWFAVNQVAPYGNEMKVYSKKHRYQGTFDMAAEINGVPMLVDFKSSAQIGDEMALQVAAYAYAYFEMTGVMLKKGLIVLVTKDRQKIKRRYKTENGVRTVKRVKIPEHKLDVREFEVNEELFQKFLQLREELVELPCPYKS